MEWSIEGPAEMSDSSAGRRTLLYTLRRGAALRTLYVVITEDAVCEDDGRAAVERYAQEEVPPRTIRIGPGEQVLPGWAAP
jgi:hypothetical protein